MPDDKDSKPRDDRFQPVRPPRSFKPGGEAKRPRRLKAADDPDSRDAPPPSPQGGGVR